MNYKLLAARFKKSFVSRKTKFLVVAFLIATSSAFAQVPSYVPTNGLVGWWPFNGNANDESGNGNNGTVNGAALTNDRAGLINSAFQFNGTSSFIQTTANGFLGKQARTFSFWVNTTSAAHQAPIDFYGGTGGAFSVVMNNPCPGIGVDCGSGVAMKGNQILLNGSWHHCVLVYDSTIVNTISDVIVYLDGQIQTQVTCSALNPNCTINNTNSTNIVFGKTASNVRYVNGKLDDIGIWNRALTQQEITALYNSQSCTSNTISADGPTTFCAGNSVNLTSDVVGGTYQWKKNGVNITTNGTSRTYKATATGSYTCVATCNGTALTSNAIQVTTKTNAFASLTASGATSFCLGDSVTLNCTNLGSNYSVQWYRTNISLENATNYSLVVKQPGTYKVVTKNLTTGCSRISGSAITTSVNCRVAGDITSGTNTEENTTNEARFTANDLSQGVNVFPNPNNGTFTFAYDGEETGDGVLQIINTMGQSIYSSAVTIKEGGYTQEIQLGDNYNKGFYIVRLLINGSYHDSRVMVR